MGSKGGSDTNHDRGSNRRAGGVLAKRVRRDAYRSGWKAAIKAAYEPAQHYFQNDPTEAQIDLFEGEAEERIDGDEAEDGETEGDAA